MEIENYRYFFFDLERTLKNWDKPTTGAEELVYSLRKKNKDVKFHADNTLLSRSGTAEQLSSNGIEAEESDVFSSSYAVASHLAGKNIKKVQVFGETGIYDELEKKGFETSKKSKTAVLGLDRQFNFNKLKRLKTLAESETGQIYSCSTEKTFKTSRKEIPGQRPVNQAVKEFGELKNAGKPSGIFREEFKNYFDYFPGRSVFIGDRAADIETGNRLGMTTVAVMSGELNREKLRKLDDIRKPDYGLSTLVKLKRKII